MKKSGFICLAIFLISFCSLFIFLKSDDCDNDNDNVIVVNGYITNIKEMYIDEGKIMVPMCKIFPFLEIDVFKKNDEMEYFSFEDKVYKIDYMNDSISINGTFISKLSDLYIKNVEGTNSRFIYIDDLISVLTFNKDNKITYSLYNNFLYIEHEPKYTYRILNDVNVTVNGVTNNIVGYRIKDFINDTEKVVVPFTKVIEVAGIKPNKEGQRIIYEHGGNEYEIDLEEKRLYLNGNDFLKYYDNTIKSDSFGPEYMRNKCFIWKDMELYVDIDMLKSLLNYGENSVLSYIFQNNDLQLSIRVEEMPLYYSYPDLYVNWRLTPVKDSYSRNTNYFVALNKLLPLIGFKAFPKDGQREYYKNDDVVCIIDHGAHYIYVRGSKFECLLDGYNQLENDGLFAEWKNGNVYIDFNSLMKMTKDSTIHVYFKADRSKQSIYIDSVESYGPHDYSSEEESKVPPGTVITD